MKILTIVTFLLVAGGVRCQDDIMTNLNLPPPNVEIPKKNGDIEKAIREKCVKANGEQAFFDLQEGKEKFKKCLTSIVDIERIQEDIEILQNDLDLFVSSPEMYNASATYCRHGPEILDCLEFFTGNWEKCLFDEERESFKLIANLTETLVEFVCEDEGERLQTFIADGGAKCLMERRENLQECFNKSLKNMWLSDVSIDDIHVLSEDEECKKFENFQNCIVKQFDTCKENNTFDRGVEDLFDQIRAVLPCENYPENYTHVSNKSEQRHAENTRGEKSNATTLIKTRERRSKFDPKQEKCDQNLYSPHIGQQVVSDSYQHFLRFLIEEKFFTNCSERIKNIEAMAKEVLAGFRLCVLEDQYLPTLAEDSVAAILNFIRKDDGAHFCDFHASFAIMCFLHSDGESHSKCLDEIEEYPVENGRAVYEKSLLCTNLKVFKECTQNFLGSVCDNPDISREKQFLHELLDEAYSPCCGSFVLTDSFLLLSVIGFWAQKLLAP